MLSAAPHVGGCHFLMGDGKVRFISENINGDTYTWLAGINDGRIIGSNSKLKTTRRNCLSSL